MTPRHLVAVGATSGLGRVWAEQRRRAGDLVSVIALPPKRDQFHVPCDVTKHSEAVAATTACVTRAMFDGMTFFQRYRGEAEPWSGEMATQLDATARLLNISVPFLNDGAAIVIVSSASAFTVTEKMSDGYHVAKAALIQLARYYAVKLGPRGIRVNCVCPGTFIKPENASKYGPDSEERKRLSRASLLGRMGEASEVAKAISFLMSDGASWITGQSLQVDGGVSLRWQEDIVS